MPKALPLCAPAPTPILETALHGVEKNTLIDLPGKGELLSKAVFDKVFYGGSSSRVRLLIRLGYVQGLHSFNLASGGLSLESSADTFHLLGFNSEKELKDFVMCPLRWNQESAPKLYFCFLVAPSSPLHSFSSLMRNFNLPFGT